MVSPTKQFRKRNAILECLRGTHAHPSAETLHQMLLKEHPDISLATVYRNLTLFKNQGLIQSLGTVDGVERFDAITDPHVHFICGSCSQVLDLPQISAPQSLCGAAEEAVGGQIDACRLIFTGTCAHCLKKNQAM